METLLKPKKVVGKITNIKKEESVRASGLACSVKDCTCKAYVQPDQGHACKTCGHYSGKHTG